MFRTYCKAAHGSGPHGADRMHPPSTWWWNVEKTRVLLVEDNDDTRHIYGLILEHSGYEVLEALNGEEAIRRARQDRPAVILMDISIPLIDGWAATRILKGDPATRRIPVIALTAHALASDRERALAAGCDGYLAKPVEPKRVVEEVRRWLEAGPR